MLYLLAWLTMADEQPPRTASDSEVLDKIAEYFKDFGQYDVFDNPSSTIEWIGDVVATSGRKAWFENASYAESDEDDE